MPDIYICGKTDIRTEYEAPDVDFFLHYEAGW